uniref:Cystatin domain-containing protein n=1 Tax=Acrobeloides nanus TaxID=290746 RepID=A0A914CX47_9BILA
MLIVTIFLLSILHIGYSDVTVNSNQGCDGCPSPVDPNSSEIKEMINRAMTNLNAISNSTNYLIPIQVTNVTSQVVAGSLTKITIQVGESTCSKTEVSAAELNTANCKISSESAPETYIVNVWQKPWENFEQITFDENPTVDTTN